MRMQLITGAAALLMGAMAARPQEPFGAPLPPPPPGAPAGAVAFNHVVVEGGLQHGVSFGFIGAEAGIPGKVVKGAPYAADAVTETTQTLSDGNRIWRKTSSPVHRDSEGRTRREMALPAIGPFPSESGVPRLVSINDPVAGAFYTLNLHDKTARKLPAGGPVVFSARTATAAPGGSMERDVMFTRAIPANRVEIRKPLDTQAARTEDLGKQVMEGVQAEGSRSVLTIPAGSVGNERPIEIVSERWYSPELQTVIMSRHLDPRAGETTYRLTNIRRVEQPRSLFEVPPDYTLSTEEAPVQMFRKRLDK